MYDTKDLIDPLAAPFELSGADDHGVLLIHGLSGSPAKLRPLAEYLNRDLAVYCPLLKGHGTSLDSLAGVRWTDWYDGVIDSFRMMQGRFQRVSVVGFSMGGVLASILAAREELFRLVTIEATLRLSDWRAVLAPIAQYFVKYTDWTDFRERFPEEADRYLLDYNIGYTGVPLRSITQLLRLTRVARRRLRSISCPALIVHSKQDETAAVESADLLLKNIVSRQKRILWLSESRHISVLGPERDIIFEQVSSFLGEGGDAETGTG